MHTIHLDRAERDILRAYEAGEFRPIPDMKTAVERYRQYATSTVRKPRSINIRIGDRDLQRIKALAAEQGVPYQTLISALIHQHSEKRPVRSPRTARKSAV